MLNSSLPAPPPSTLPSAQRWRCCVPPHAQLLLVRQGCGCLWRHVSAPRDMAIVRTLASNRGEVMGCRGGGQGSAGCHKVSEEARGRASAHPDKGAGYILRNKDAVASPALLVPPRPAMLQLHPPSQAVW